MELYRIQEVSRLCGVSREMILTFVEEEWLSPAVRENLSFDQEDIARVRLILLLRQEFGVNDESMSIILQLIDQLNRLHIEISR